MVQKKPKDTKKRQKSDTPAIEEHVSTAPEHSEASAQAGALEKKAKPQAPRSRAIRIIGKAAKVMFLYMPLGLIVLVVLAIAGLSMYLTPKRAERLIVEQFNARSRCGSSGF
jgi:ferric-dicitrate binding protein FerR (iron transport regulator)